MTRLDLVNASQRCQNAAVPFNSGTRFGDRNEQADSRHCAAFFMPIRASLPSLSGGGGDTREGMPVSVRRFANPITCPAPTFGDVGRVHTQNRRQSHA